MDYREFISGKVRKAKAFGFEPVELNDHLFDWQKKIVEWAVRRGRAAIFAECGLGKTLMQLDWAKEVVWKTGLPVMLHCPVGVREQTLNEAKKFGIHMRVNIEICDSMKDVRPQTICLVNYEKLHKFDVRHFGGVVLDESSILKNFAGKVRTQLIKTWSDVQYKLACTATPAPNDFVELGNHSEFLDVMPRETMLSIWFVNDTANTGTWRLKGHAVNDFWNWVSTWASCVGKPSDMGGCDDGFELPELKEYIHHVETKDVPMDGMLFNNFELTATTVHQQKRHSVKQRADRVAELIGNDRDPWIVWCDSNYEADALLESIPGAVDVRGSDSDKIKQQRLIGFSNGEIKRLVTKPSIAGFGMNWQHCNKMAFVGLSYSFEAYYQAIRRCWRFGQKRPVHAHIVEADGESALRLSVEKKQQRFSQMRLAMSDMISGVSFTRDVNTYEPTIKMEVPQWM